MTDKYMVAHNDIDAAADMVSNGVTTNDEQAALSGVSIFATVLAHTLIDLAQNVARAADAVTRLADQTQADIAAAIEREADALATVKQKETSSRAFFGQRAE